MILHLIPDFKGNITYNRESNFLKSRQFSYEIESNFIPRIGDIFTLYDYILDPIIKLQHEIIAYQKKNGLNQDFLFEYYNLVKQVQLDYGFENTPNNPDYEVYVLLSKNMYKGWLDEINISHL